MRQPNSIHWIDHAGRSESFIGCCLKAVSRKQPVFVQGITANAVQKEAFQTKLNKKLHLHLVRTATERELT